MAVSHGFNLTEATTSVSAPVQVSSGLQIIVGTAPVNQLANPAAAVNTPLYVSTYKEAVAAVGWSSDFAKYTPLRGNLRQLPGGWHCTYRRNQCS